MSVLGAALVLIAAQAAPPKPVEQPSGNAIGHARMIVRYGPTGRAVPCIARAELDRIIADHASMSALNRKRLEAIGEAEMLAMLERYVEVAAMEMAMVIPEDSFTLMLAYLDLHTTGQNCSSPPLVSEATLAQMDVPRFSKSVRTAFCAETGKLCP